LRNFTRIALGAFVLSIACAVAAAMARVPVARGQTPQLAANPAELSATEVHDRRVGPFVRRRRLAAWGAAAKPDPSFAAPMTITLVRSAETGCEPHCAEWIAAQGKIETGSVDRFQQVFDQLGQRNVPILIHSPGGRVDAAMAIGRMIRKRHMDVIVARTRLQPCSKAESSCPSNSEARGVPDSAVAGCESACPIILAGGRRRIVSPWAQVGVHQVKAFETYTKVYRLYRVSKVGQTITQRSLISERKSERIVALKNPQTKVTSQLSQYFTDMGIGDGLMTTMAATPNSTLHILSSAELNATRLATDFAGPQKFLGQHADDPAPIDRPDLLAGAQADHLILTPIPLSGAIPQRAALVVATPGNTATTKPYLGTVAWRLIELSGPDGEPRGMAAAADIDIPDAGLSALVVIENRSQPERRSIDVRLNQAGHGVAPIRDVGTPRWRNDETPLGLPVASVRTKTGDLRFHFEFVSREPERGQIIGLISKAKWMDLPLLLDGNIPAKITWEKGMPGDKALSLAYPAAP
jgi:hypothetical protein